MFTSTRRSRRRLALPWALAALAAALIGVGCGDDDDEPAATGGGTTTAASEPAKAVYGVLPFTALGPVQIGLDEGIFAKHGIQLETLKLRQSTDSLPNLLSGRQNFGNLQPGSVQLAIQEGAKLKILAPVAFSSDADRLFVKADSDIRSVEDLRGKKIGVALLTGSATAGLLKILEDAGLGKDDVRLVATPVAQAAAALDKGTVDAAQILEPFAVGEGDKIRAVIDDLYAPFGPTGEVVQGFHITTEDFAAKNPEVVRNFQAAIQEANELAASDDALVRKAATTLAGVPAPAAGAMALPRFGTDMALESAERQMETMKEYGFLEETVPFESLVFE